MNLIFEILRFLSFLTLNTMVIANILRNDYSAATFFLILLIVGYGRFKSSKVVTVHVKEGE